MNTYNFKKLSIIINSLINFQNDPLNTSNEDIENLKDYFYYKFADTFITFFPHKEYSYKREDFIIGTFGNHNNNYLFFKSNGDPCITIGIKYDIYIDKIIDQKIFYDKMKCKFKTDCNFRSKYKLNYCGIF